MCFYWIYLVAYSHTCWNLELLVSLFSICFMLFQNSIMISQQNENILFIFTWKMYSKMVVRITSNLMLAGNESFFAFTFLKFCWWINENMNALKLCNPIDWSQRKVVFNTLSVGVDREIRFTLEMREKKWIL